MAFALLIIGAVMLVAAVRGTTDGPTGLWGLLKADLTGQNNFIFWLVAILVIGAVGYIPKLKPVSVAFLTLVVLVLFLAKGNPSGVGGGFFQQFFTGLNAAPASTAAPATTVIGPGSTSLPPATINLPAMPTIGNFVN